MLRPSKEPDVLDFMTKQRSNNLSHEQTDTTIERYLQRVFLARQSLFAISLFFLDTHTVLPMHCNKAINTLEEAGKLIQEFCEFLQPRLSVSSTSSAPHYRLLCLLYSIRERTSDLSDLIDSYIPAYQQPRAPFATKQRRYISHSFEILLQDTALALQAGPLKEAERAPTGEILPVPLLYLADHQNKRAQVEH